MADINGLYRLTKSRKKKAERHIRHAAKSAFKLGEALYPVWDDDRDAYMEFLDAHSMTTDGGAELLGWVKQYKTPERMFWGQSSADVLMWLRKVFNDEGIVRPRPL